MILTYPYDIENNYDFDSDKIQITASKTKLKLQQGDVDFTEDFADDIGHTYDSDLAEFVSGLVRQKDQRQVNATFGANYNIDINANWGNGVLTGTTYGGASISGNKLDLAHNDIRCMDYDAIDNADNVQQGAYRFKLTPNYSGSPDTEVVFFCNTKAHNDVTNAIFIRHSNGGALRVHLFGSNGVIILEQYLGTWIAVQGQEYEWEFNFNLDTGQHALFIDGEKKGTMTVKTGTRDSNIGLLRIGSGYQRINNSNFFIDDFIVFDTVQHTANYTKGYTVSDYIYLENSVILPEMEHTGEGTIKLFNSLTTTYAGSPKILLEIGRSGNKLYWNGSAWVVSDETYDQATDPVTFNANCPTLDVDGENYGQFTIVFPDSNTLSSVDELTANMNVDIGYLTTNPTIRPKAGQKMDGLTNWLETLTKIGDDNVKRLIQLDNDIYYLLAGEWTITETEDYNLAMTIAEILAEKESLLTEGYGKTFLPITFLHSDDGSTTPELDTDVITYNFSGEDYDLTEITIYQDNLSLLGEGYQEYLTVRTIDNVIGTRSLIRNKENAITINENGTWEAHIYIEDVEPTYLLWDFGGDKIKTEFPDESIIIDGKVRFSDLTIV